MRWYRACRHVAQRLGVRGWVQLVCAACALVLLCAGIYPLYRMMLHSTRGQELEDLQVFAQRLEAELGLLGLDLERVDSAENQRVRQVFSMPFRSGGVYPMMVHPSGRIVYHFLREGERIPPDVMEQMAFSPGRTGWVELQFSEGHGQKRELAYRYSQRLGCYLAVEFPPPNTLPALVSLRAWWLIVLVVWLSLAVVVGGVLGRAIRRQLEGMSERLACLARGEHPPRREPHGFLEMRRILVSLNRLTHGLERTTEFAKSIGRAAFDVPFTPLGPNDSLGCALVELRNSLGEQEAAAADRKAKDAIHGWTNQGLAEFGQILRERSGSITELADALIQHLVNYLEAAQGGVFTVGTGSDGAKVLLLTASFAYGRKKFLAREVHFGEGLVGTCAIERDTIHLNHVPEGYSDLTSGIGQAPPTELLLVPLKTDEELLGVLELASVRGFQPHEIEFVKMVSSSIASTLLTAQSNQRNADLLQQAQAQQVQMREQEEEMRQNLEEIQATQEEMERRTHEVEVLRSAVREGMLYGELNEAGVWLTANHKIEEIYRQMGREGIEGTQFVANTDWQSAHGAKGLEMVWSDVLHGEHIEGEFTLHAQNSGDRVVRGILYPNRNEDGTLLCVYFIGVEITETHGESKLGEM